MQPLIRRQFIRDVEGANLMEVFFVTGVSSVLLIRAFLSLTGYPQLNPGRLHIAHVLAGGFLMLAALIVLLAFVNRSARYMAAALGGFGFGAFIDEIGKFVTGDNNYFFQPAVAIIYITFVLLYLVIQHINHQPWLSEEEKLVNVLELTEEVVLRDMDAEEMQRAMELLEDANAENPVAEALRQLLHNVELTPRPKPNLYAIAKIYLRRLYWDLVRKGWFTTLMIGLSIALSLFSLLLNSRIVLYPVLFGSGLPPPSLASFGGIISASVAALFALAGVLKISGNRLEAYRLFRISVLIQILFAEVFIFLEEQLAGILKLGIDVISLVVLRYLISQEMLAGNKGLSPSRAAAAKEAERESPGK